MSKLIIFGHPTFEESLYHRAYLDQLKHSGIEVLNVDHYRTSAELAVARKRMEEATDIYLQFPFHWYGLPHNFKRFIDELFIHGWAFGFEGKSALNGKRLYVITTTGGGEETYQAGGYNGYAVSDMLTPLKVLATLSEMTYSGELVFYGCSGEGPDLKDLTRYREFLDVGLNAVE